MVSREGIKENIESTSSVAMFQYLQEEQPGVMTRQIYQIFRPSDSCPDVAGPLWRRSRPLFNRWGRSRHDLIDALMVLDELLALAGVEGGRGWEDGIGVLSDGRKHRPLVTRQLCNSGEAEVGEAVRSPLFTHSPIPSCPIHKHWGLPHDANDFLRC